MSPKNWQGLDPLRAGKWLHFTLASKPCVMVRSRLPAPMHTCVRTWRKIVTDACSAFKDGETRHQNVGNDTEIWISPRRA